MNKFTNWIAGALVASLVALPFAGTYLYQNAGTASDSVTVSVEKAPPELKDAASEAVVIKGLYDIEIVRDGKTIETRHETNLITLEGRRYLLAAALHNTASSTAATSAYDTVASSTYVEKPLWYVKLITANITPTAACNHTNTSIGGAGKEWVNYDGSVRKTWVGVLDSTGTSAVSTNLASRAEFTIDTAGGYIYGAALVSSDVLDSVATGEYQISYSQFTSPITVSVGDVVKVTITITLSPAT